MAVRCSGCGMKALLSEEAAAALVHAGEKVEAYACPIGDGWHVRRTDLAARPPTR